MEQRLDLVTNGAQNCRRFGLRFGHRREEGVEELGVHGVTEGVYEQCHTDTEERCCGRGVREWKERRGKHVGQELWNDGGLDDGSGEVRVSIADGWDLAMLEVGRTS